MPDLYLYKITCFNFSASSYKYFCHNLEYFLASNGTAPIGGVCCRLELQ